VTTTQAIVDNKRKSAIRFLDDQAGQTFKIGTMACIERD